MAWPSKTLTSAGFKDFKSPIENIKGKAPVDAWGKDEFKDKHGKNWKGFNVSYDPKADWTKPDDMKESKWKEENEQEEKKARESGISYWTIKNNPLFEHAAGKLNIDWKAFTTQYADTISYEGLKTQAALTWGTQTHSPLDAMSEGERILAAALPEMKKYYDADGNVIRTERPYRTRYGLDGRVAGSDIAMENIYKMNKWINNTVKAWNEKYDAPIIARGPTSEQYGLPKGTDPWEFYGLDKVPRILPKTLDVDYKLNLNDAFSSSAKYNTPRGYPGIDLSGVEPAEVGKSFTDYISDYEFAQEHGYWDYDIGSGGDPTYKDELKFIFGDAHDDIRIFGQKDYDALVNQGMDKEGVRDIINARLKSGQKLILGPAMAKHFDMYSYDPGWWGQPSGTLGQKGVRLLRLQGLDDAGIMNRYAKTLHGSQIGQWVKDNFGIRIWPETDPVNPGMYDYYFMDPGDKRAFGMKDYNQFLDQGMDPKRIKQIAKELTSAGWTLGAEAAELMGLRGYQAGVSIESNNGYLNGEVFNTYQATGWDNDKLMELALSDKTTLIGWQAAEKLFGWKERGDKGSFGMKDITENWPDGPIDRPDRVTLGKIAGGVADTIGPSAADYIWGNELYDIHMAPPVGAKPDAFTFGKDAINYLRNHPTNPVKNIKTLRAIARGAHWIGEAAAKELGLTANKPPMETKTLQQVLSTPLTEYDKPDLITGTTGGFGQQEIDWMTTAKWTTAQMRAVTDKFDSIGPAAAKHLWGAQLTAHMQAPANAVDPSKTTFGQETMKYLDRIDPQISDKSLAAIARGAADYVGEWALDYFADKGIDVGKESAPIKTAPPPPPPTPQKDPYVEQGNRGHFESSDLNYMRDRGYTRAEIRKVAESQGQIGTAAAQWIYDWSPRGGDFGQQDYNALKSKGASESTIKNIAKNQSNIGEAMARHFWGYTDPGNEKGWFGQADYDQLKGRGASDDIMRKIIRGMGLKTGQKFKHLG